MPESAKKAASKNSVTLVQKLLNSQLCFDKKKEPCSLQPKQRTKSSKNIIKIARVQQKRYTIVNCPAYSCLVHFGGSLQEKNVKLNGQKDGTLVNLEEIWFFLLSPINSCKFRRVQKTSFRVSIKGGLISETIILLDPWS